MAITCNRLIQGDCLDVLRDMSPSSIDLAYLDPPFFSNRNYAVIYGDCGEVRSFRDKWDGGIDHYISWLLVRVEQVHRVLRDSGVVFLHCDWHANAYIRVKILDKIFGEKNFVNEIVWQKIRTTKSQSKQFGNVFDTLYFYCKSQNQYTFTNQSKEFDPKYIKSHYKPDEKTGKLYQLVSLSQQGQGSPKKFGDRVLAPPNDKHWIWSQERIDQAMADGTIAFTASGTPRKKQYLDNMIGDTVDNLWDDIAPINSQASERVGYPTQKPEALLERIIRCASKEGYVVLDPFVGGGTTIAVAEKLNRSWIGIDQSPYAIKVSEMRLQKQGHKQIAPYSVHWDKCDWDCLFNKEP
ncbi:MAG: hypothetical protein FWD57_04585 [Polyangiaceae bacterium]|nr:hypothetical protein [Polyangiaceae bacterium]